MKTKDSAINAKLKAFSKFVCFKDIVGSPADHDVAN
jgi:hypothetical protein